MCTIQRNILDARRWLSLFLVCCFVLCGLGGIHQRAQAVVGLSTAAIAIILAGLAAVGITFVSTGAYNSLSGYVSSLFGQYASSRGLSVGSLLSGTNEGVNVAGQILLNNKWVTVINGFAEWIVDTFTLTDNTTTNVQSASSINGIELTFVPYSYRINTGITWEWYYTAGSGVVALVFFECATTSNRFIATMAFSNAPFQVLLDREQIRNGEHTYNTYTGVQNNDYYFVVCGSTAKSDWTRSGSTAPIAKVYTDMAENNQTAVFNHLKSLIDGQDIPDADIDVQVGNINLPLDDPSYTSGDGAVLDVGASWGATLPQATDQVIPGAWTAGQSGVTSLTYEPIGSIQDQVNPEGSQVIDQNPENYGVPGLQDVFPFCIPFDIYNLLSALAADPVAPSFTWRFYVPRVCDETFTVDLSPFDTVAQIVRTVELLAFIVGLAMVTRERFLRG